MDDYIDTGYVYKPIDTGYFYNPYFPSEIAPARKGLLTKYGKNLLTAAEKYYGKKSEDKFVGFYTPYIPLGITDVVLKEPEYLDILSPSKKKLEYRSLNDDWDY